MSNWDNEVIFEAYKKQNIPLEESISVLLKNDLILANDIYNEWSMSDWHSGIKKVAQKASNVGGFLMDKVKKYIVEPLLGKNREVLSKLSKVKTKEELAQLLKTYGEDAAFQLINNEAITNAERRVQNNESYVGFWDLILLEAEQKTESNPIIKPLVDIVKSLGAEGIGYCKDYIDGTQTSEIPDPAAQYLTGIDDEDDQKVTKEFKRLISILSKTKQFSNLKQSGDINVDGLIKILKNKNFIDYSDDEIQTELIDALKNKSSDEETQSELAIQKPKALKSTKAVSKLDVKAKRAASALQRISEVMPTNPQDVQTVINLIASPEKLQGEARNSLQKAIKKGGKQAVKAVVELAGKISTGMMPPPALNILDLLIQKYGAFIVTLSDEFKSSKDIKQQNVNEGEKRAYDQVKSFALTFGSLKKLTNFLAKIESKKIKTKNTEQQAYIDYLNSDGRQFLEAIKVIASKVFAKDKASSSEEAPKSGGSELEVVAPERKFQPKDVVNIFKLVDLFFQKFAPQTKSLTLAFQQNQLDTLQQQRTTVGSLMSQRYGIKNINQAIQILNKSSDPKEIAKAIMFVTFEKNANEEVQPEQFDSVELGLAKKITQWIDEIKKTKSTSKLKETFLQKGFDKNVVEAIANAFAKLSNVSDLDVQPNPESSSTQSKINEIDLMVDRISKGDEQLKQDILSALEAAEERIRKAKDAEEKRKRTEELRNFLLSKGFATEQNISHVMAVLDHLGRGGLVQPNEPAARNPQEANTTEGLKDKVKQMGSTSFFKIAYDIIMDRQKMMSLGVGMAILFICFLLFGAPFLALLYVAIKAKQSENGQEQESEQPQQQKPEPKDQEPPQPSAMGNLKQAVVDKTKEVATKTANAVTNYMKPKPTTA